MVASNGFFTENMCFLDVSGPLTHVTECFHNLWKSLLKQKPSPSAATNIPSLVKSSHLEESLPTRLTVSDYDRRPTFENGGSIYRWIHKTGSRPLFFYSSS